MDLDARLLRSFVVLAETLHFGRAAERLHLSQPTLSQQIRRLERQLGVTLLERSSRRVELSAAGAASCGSASPRGCTTSRRGSWPSSGPACA